jgi:hypothetical protein
MTLDLTDEETEALPRELDHIIDGDRYQLSGRVRMLKAIRANIGPEAERPPLSAALRASEDEDNSEQRADRRQTPKDLRDLCSPSAKRRS